MKIILFLKQKSNTSRPKQTAKYCGIRRFRISGLIWWASSKILILLMEKEVPYVDKYSVLKDFWHWILMVMLQLILLNYHRHVYARLKSNHFLICYHQGTVQIPVSICYIIWHYWAFHPILVTSFLVVFGHKVTEILRNNLFILHFILPIRPCKQKT